MDEKEKRFFLVLLFIFFIAFIILNNTHVSIVAIDNNYGKIVNHGSVEEHVIALTFDDGPHPKYTNEILDLLKEYDVKATFFVLGKLAEAYPDIIKRQWKEGHEIGNHTYSHIDTKKVTKEVLLEEYEKTQNIIFELTNNKPKLFRPPYGSFNNNTIDIMETNNSVIVLWSAHQDSKDWKNPEVKNIVNTTLSNLRNGDIILFHDYVYFENSNTIEALKKIIPELKKRGYRFVTVSELMNLESSTWE